MVHVQTFTVQAGVTSLAVVATGAGTASIVHPPYSTTAGSLGASVSTSFAVVPGEVLTLNVGGMNGYNGGGAGNQSGINGGGATDIRRAPAGTPIGQAGSPGYADQLVVAAGRGGAAYDYAGYRGASGGNGGTPNGGAGSAIGTGATQTAAGSNGARGQGGAEAISNSSIATGGGSGGYYGGGGSADGMPAGHGRSSGGGGSSWSVTAATYNLATSAANGSLTLTYTGVNYAQLAPILIEALKEQQAQIEALKQQAATATQRVAQAETSLSGFEQRLRALEAAGGAQAQR